LNFDFLSLTVEALQGKKCQVSLLSGGVGQFEPTAVASTALAMRALRRAVKMQNKYTVNQKKTWQFIFDYNFR